MYLVVRPECKLLYIVLKSAWLQVRQPESKVFTQTLVYTYMERKVWENVHQHVNSNKSNSSGWWGHSRFYFSFSFVSFSTLIYFKCI